MIISEILENKLEILKNIFREKVLIVAFSGGMDSSLLAYLSQKYAKSTLLITFKSILNSDEEIEEAISFAQKYKIDHEIIETNPLQNYDFVANPKNRCYICKKELFIRLKNIQKKRNFDLIIEGSNLDDLGDYRPGLNALKELGITSPYLEAEISKDEIRELSQLFQLHTESKPSGACFASRIPYNQEITKEKLNMVQKAEKYLKDYYKIDQVRVRVHEGTLARIEVLKSSIKRILSEKFENIVKKFKDIGFCYVTIDLEGFRSGSLNEVLN